ncbi:MAG: hypothetical protein ACRDE2_14805 [Chitinophagaceae bacterium]
MDKPTGDDFISGWRVFYKLIEILNPDYCLFLGVKASNFIERSVSPSNNIQLLKYEWGSNPINGTFPRYAELKTLGNHAIKLFFIKHPNRFFTCSLWNNYLNRTKGSILDTFRKNLS